MNWIDAKERLPEKGIDYLCRCVMKENIKYPFYMVLQYKLMDVNPHFRFECDNGLRVTHWMPIPEFKTKGSEKEVIELYKKAIETYGKDHQLTVAVEELSELTKEICKFKRGADNRAEIIEEMADCYIMLQQLMIIFGIEAEEIENVKKQKIIRLQKTIGGKEK